ALPTELLSYIFLLGFDNGIDPARPFKRRELESELNFEVRVSHVSRLWRSVALRTPALWTGIRLRKPAHLDRAVQFVVRSRNQPLDILLDTVAEADYEPGHRLGINEFDAGFRAAIDHTRRWRSLIVKVCDLPCKERARANLRDCPPIPRLETLQLWHVQDWSDAANMIQATRKPPIPILSDHVPSLLNASLVGVNLAYNQTHYLAGLRQLELALHAEFCRPTSAEFDSILRACPHLHRLSLHYSGPRVDPDADPADAPAIRLERLSELALTNMDVDVVAHVVRRLAMPNLRALELELPALQEGLDFSPVLDLLLADPANPAFPRLETLLVADLACEPTAWAHLLASVPALRHLQVDFTTVGDAFFAPLLHHHHHHVHLPAPTSPDAPTPRNAILLPVLEVLKVSGLPSARLRELAEFRREAGCGVPHFCVHLRSVDEDTDRLQDDGFDVSYFGIEEAVEADEEDGEEYSDEEGEEESEQEGGGQEGDEDGDAQADEEAEVQPPETSSPEATHVGEGDYGPAAYDTASTSDLGEDDEDDDDDDTHTQAGSVEPESSGAHYDTHDLYKYAMV
ncbi:hypothetical protein K488DRAFT_41003, partial [Vararia minispora EC-137]